MCVVTPRIESPALSQEAARLPAFEMKFVVPEADARAAEQQLRPHLALDPHADPSRGNAYRITSVCFDTPNFDVYYRTDGQRARKFRIRRYGEERLVFLERKTKRSQQVRKRRVGVPQAELGWLDGAAAPDWPGLWFARRLELRGLRPVCRITYERTAYVGSGPGGPVRVTFDRGARGREAAGPNPEPFAGGPALLDDEVILEFKFLGALPALFKDAIEGLRLTPRAGSKYRRCVDALGLAGRSPAHA